MWKRTFLISVATLLLILEKSTALKCFQCHSSQPGCGVYSVDYILQGWKECPGTETDPPMCVKIKNTVGSQTTVTRGCLSTLLKETQIREDMPSVRRHSYCIPAKSDSTYGPSYINSETKKLYCFCNDLWLCNSASSFQATISFALACVLMTWML
ncbi:UPAR/Ly6 domain-containing protein crim-like [Watersipora subatra]|uniref:UPAR/Ly6 domain-containing protein crim-like n=1 Tax=Watersipora subatra TaxID=2589382 RepID=UPI00355AF644